MTSIYTCHVVWRYLVDPHLHISKQLEELPALLPIRRCFSASFLESSECSDQEPQSQRSTCNLAESGENRRDLAIGQKLRYFYLGMLVPAYFSLFEGLFGCSPAYPGFDCHFCVCSLSRGLSGGHPMKQSMNLRILELVHIPKGLHQLWTFFLPQQTVLVSRGVDFFGALRIFQRNSGGSEQRKLPAVGKRRSRCSGTLAFADPATQEAWQVWMV